MRKLFLGITILANGLLLLLGLVWTPALWGMLLTIPPTLIGIYDMYQDEYTITRNFPFIGRFRWFAEELRPKIYQYFVESNT
ncbi:MAG: FMN-binding glutamate synthase family protein, partial [bacterium]